MSDNYQELTDRYIYQVTSRLPKAQLDDVAMELRELIGDMAEEKGSVEDALIALGDPAEFAKKYTGDSGFLIGPTYYSKYLSVLKIALICTAISVFVIVLLQSIVDGYTVRQVVNFSEAIQVVAKAFAQGLGSMISSVIGVFGTVTLVFAIMERQKVDLDEVSDKAWRTDKLKEKPIADKSIWTPAKLTAVPSKKALLPRSDSIVDIVFSIILSAPFIFAPQILGVMLVKYNVVKTISIFNLDQWNIILPFLLISLAAGLADAILRLIIGRYNMKVMLSSIMTNVIQIVCAIIVIKVLPVWNPSFALELQLFLDENQSDFACVTCLDSNWFLNILLAVIIVFAVIDIAVTIYKTLRYGSEVGKAS